MAVVVCKLYKSLALASVDLTVLKSSVFFRV